MIALAILQARMSSSRLPGKVLMDVEGLPMIARQIYRISRSTLIDEIVVATSLDSSVDVWSMYLKDRGVKVQQGSSDDVLMRFVDVTKNFEFQTVVRLTADCPITDPEIIDATIQIFLDYNVDYVSNSLVRTFPRELDTEVFRSEILQELSLNDFRPLSQEHVTYGIYSRPELNSVLNYSQSSSCAHLRWTLDTSDYLKIVRNVYRYFLPQKENLLQGDVLIWLREFLEFAHYEVSA